MDNNWDQDGFLYHHMTVTACTNIINEHDLGLLGVIGKRINLRSPELLSEEHMNGLPWAIFLMVIAMGVGDTDTACGRCVNR